MSIRPIDLQVIVPKAQSNPNAREHVVNKEAMQLQQSQMENKRESTIKDHRVNELAHKDSKDNGKVEEKKEKELDQRQKKKRATAERGKEVKETVQKNEKKPIAKDWNFHRFDMKV